MMKIHALVLLTLLLLLTSCLLLSCRQLVTKDYTRLCSHTVTAARYSAHAAGWAQKWRKYFR